jgi:hypothetical protein
MNQTFDELDKPIYGLNDEARQFWLHVKWGMKKRIGMVRKRRDTKVLAMV